MNLRSPGVYIREVNIRSPLRVRMDITGFVGQAERGPINYPQPISNWGQYQDIFGDFVGYGYLPYSIFAFFANSGELCYVTRVAHESAQKATLETSLVDKKGNFIIDITAINEGIWANEIEVTAYDESSDALVLTELESELNIGDDSATFKSVAGFMERDPGGSGNGDQILLIHSRDPLKQEKLSIRLIDFAKKLVTFDKAVNNDFPVGSSVIGKGFNLIFRYQREGKLIKGEVFDNLSMDPEHERYFKRIINGDPEEKNYLTKIDSGHSILVRVTDLRLGNSKECYRIKNAVVKLENGKDSNQNELNFYYFTGYKNKSYFHPKFANSVPESLTENENSLVGMAALEAIEEIGLIAIPDLIIPDFYKLAADHEMEIPKEGIIFAKIPEKISDLTNLKHGQYDMLYHCKKMGERFAILDSPRSSEIGTGENKIEDWTNNFHLLPESKSCALYYPWIKQKAADFQERDLLIPPSGHVAGIYSRTEKSRGVAKAPANEVIQGAVDLEFNVNDSQQAILNPKGVNCLRFLPGRGLRIWGARTLCTDPLWLYVNVRRLTLAIIKNIVINLQWTVFEPNNSILWGKIVANLTIFFNTLFNAGALAGTTPEDAFFVKCDEEINTSDIIGSGLVLTEVGFAPAKPAEFILVTIKRTPGALSVFEL